MRYSWDTEHARGKVANIYINEKKKISVGYRVFFIETFEQYFPWCYNLLFSYTINNVQYYYYEHIERAFTLFQLLYRTQYWNARFRNNIFHV